MDERTCIAPEGCAEPVIARGLCSKHYIRLRRRGTLDAPLPPPDLPGEHWLPVASYEGLYEVSDLGRVKSLPRPGCRNGNKSRLYGGRIIVQHAAYGGYLTVGLWRDGKSTQARVHKLVAAAFLGPCPPGQMVCHGPSGILNNSVGNLSYGTAAKNGADMVRDGTSVTGIKNHSAKLTEADVIQIRRRHANGEAGYRVLARDYGVDQGQIRLIVKRKNWKHVT